MLCYIAVLMKLKEYLQQEIEDQEDPDCFLHPVRVNKSKTLFMSS